MPNINIAAIEGFESMSPEQKVEALLKVEVPEKIDMSQYVSKDTSNKLASENKALKDQLKAKMSDDEKATAEREAKWAEMEAEIAQLKREKMEGSYKASYLALGYSEKLAEAAAKAMADGDIDKVFDYQKQAAEDAEKARANAEIKTTPRPTGTVSDNTNAETEAVALAKRLASRRRETNNASNEILKHYTNH